MKLALVIPFVDTWDITKRCLEKVAENTSKETEIWLIDNGSEKHYYDEILGKLGQTKGILGGFDSVHYHITDQNAGVLATFKQGFELTKADIICFIHNDVLIQEAGWDKRVIEAFESNEKLGLVGLFGAIGVGDNGGRVRSQSNMLGLEWGSCDCHDIAWKHHSENMLNLAPATILDGVGMFFRREALEALIHSDMFAEWRAPHHFYDRIMPLKLIDKGWKIGTLGIGFDHWSGATANSSESYNDLCIEWAVKNHIGGEEWVRTTGPDHVVYIQAEQQFFDEFGKRLPCTVDSNWNYNWTGII